MKKSFIVAALVAWAMNVWAQETHFDFSIINSTGYEMFYRIVDAQNHWVEVTYPCQNGDNYWWGYDKPEGKLILSDTVSYDGIDYILVAIGDHAFCGCLGLRGTLEFPETVQSIGAGAFKGCSNFNGSLTIPAALTRIEDEVFCGCSGFATKLYLPDSLTYIGARAFQQCAFKGMLMLPSTLTVIGDEAFKGCTSFNSISIKAVTPPTTGSNAFDEIPTWISVAVPYNAKDAYQNTSGWSRFASRIIEKSYWNGKAEPWTKGSGTTEDPYLIESAENLAWLAKSVNERQDLVIDTGYSMGGGWYLIYCFNDVNAYQDTCFRLVIDLDLGKGSGLYWKSIGNVHYIDENNYPGPVFGPHYYLDVFNNREYYFYTSFCGNFDGNGNEISNYMMYDDYWDLDYEVRYRGLFGMVSNCSLFNLNINNLSINSQQTNKIIGGLVGSASNTVIVNCHTSGLLKSGNVGSWDNSNTMGGIVGLSQNCRIENSTSQATIDAVTYWNLSGSRAVGGIVGTMVCDTIPTSQNGVFRCYYNGIMQNLLTVAGGIVGLCDGTSDGKGVARIENCYNKGSMTSVDNSGYSGSSVLGGIVGYVADLDTLFMINCYSNDTIAGYAPGSSYDNTYAGGLIAKAEATTTLYIKNCYHVGPISSKYKGGILAQNTNMTLVRNSFFDRTVAPDDGFGLPLESDYMKAEAFVSQLNNGSSVFTMDTEPYENDGYPIFGTDGLIFVGAEWYYEILNDDGSITYQHLQCTGDTTIHNKRPKVIVRSNTQYDKEGHTEVTREYVYEENGIVYWWNRDLQDFTILYDFSAEVGDQWEIKVGNESFVTRVYDMETQMINGIPYKRMTIGDDNNIFSGIIISTIGHLTSFFPERLMTQGKGYRVNGLRCYWVNDVLLYHTGDDDCDAIYAEWHNGIEEDGSSTGPGTFTVYPNPTNNVLFVETRFITSQPITYRITNLMGQTLLHGVLAAETQRIDISNLPAGMYFISMGNETVKFVKE